MSYAGYEDEDYGEPDVEAEEIRPPSGLGRAATVLEFNDSVVNNSKCAAASFSREVVDFNMVLHSTELWSLPVATYQRIKR